MDCVFNQQQEREDITPQHSPQLQLKRCLPLAKYRKFTNPNPQSTLGFWVSSSLRKLYYKVRFTSGSCLRRLHYDGMMVNNSIFYASSVGAIEEGGQMEKLKQKNECIEGGGNGIVGTFAELIEEERRRSRSSSSSSCDFSREAEEQRDRQSILMESFSPPPISWSMENPDVPDCSTSVNGGDDDEEKPVLDYGRLEKQVTTIPEIEMMKERFSKLLLGEDMSGSGNGVSTALAISNAITNLCATLFGQLWRLEPLQPEKKAMWKREMEWLLCVSDHIVEFSPTWQTFPDGTKLEVMTCRPRTDLYINLPALRKLDNMLLDILDSFENPEFWYVDQGILALEADGSASFRKALQRQEEKWWLPVPRVPPGGLHENSRKHLQHKRDSTNQILKAAMAINSVALADMAVPESYLDALPKNGKACLGDTMYRYITSDQLSPECLLDNLDLSSEHQAIEVANRIEASMYVWRRRTNLKPVNSTNRSGSRSSWELVKDLMIDADKRECLADRAESVLLCLKQWFPGLPQTTLDMSKIQFNKDVGKSILESYSRVLESLAFNVVARIDDLLYVDDLTKHSDHFSSISKVSLIPHKSVTIPYAVPVSGTPYKSAITTQRLTPARLFSPLKGERSSFVASGKLPHMGIGVKKVSSEDSGKSADELDSLWNASLEASPSPSGLGSVDKTKYYVSPGK